MTKMEEEQEDLEGTEESIVFIDPEEDEVDELQDEEITQRRPGPSFFTRLLRLAVFIFLAMAVVVAMAGAGWLGVKELRRTYENVGGRVDNQTEQLTQLEEQLNNMQTQSGDQQATLEALGQEVAAYDEELSTLQLTLDQGLARQTEFLDALELKVGGLLSDTEVLTRSIALQASELTVAQGDISAAESHIDDMGGDVEALRSDLSILQLDSKATADELTAADVPGLRRAILTFRIWELVTRARLRLAEQNLGLAAADVETALAIYPILAALSPQEFAGPLEQVSLRLRLAAAGLPDSPATAVNDLDAAWQELDTILALTLGLDAPVVSIPTPTETITGTETVETALTGTPELTETAAPPPIEETPTLTPTAASP